MNSLLDSDINQNDFFSYIDPDIALNYISDNLAELSSGERKSVLDEVNKDFAGILYKDKKKLHKGPRRRHRDTLRQKHSM